MNISATPARAASHKPDLDQWRVAAELGAFAFGGTRAGVFCGWRIAAGLRRLRVKVFGLSVETAGM
jgi:hypothetical protein